MQIYACWERALYALKRKSDLIGSGELEWPLKPCLSQVACGFVRLALMAPADGKIGIRICSQCCFIPRSGVRTHRGVHPARDLHCTSLSSQKPHLSSAHTNRSDAGINKRLVIIFHYFSCIHHQINAGEQKLLVSKTLQCKTSVNFYVNLFLWSKLNFFK